MKIKRILATIMAALIIWQCVAVAEISDEHPDVEAGVEVVGTPVNEGDEAEESGTPVVLASEAVETPDGDSDGENNEDPVVEPGGDTTVEPSGDANGEPGGDTTVEPSGDANGEPGGDATAEPEGDENGDSPEEDGLGSGDEADAGENTDTAEVEAVLPALQEYTLGVGEAADISEYTLMPEGIEAEIEYICESESAVISEEHWFKANAEGEYEVILRALNGIEAVIDITVLPEPQGISIAAERDCCYIGEYIECSASVNEGSAGGYTWSVDGEGILEDQGNGKYLAVGVGEARINAETYNGVSSSFTVSVVALPTALGLNASELKMNPGDTFQLEYSMDGENLGTVKYASSDINVAAVDAGSGEITAVGTGSAIITASGVNGLTAECSVNVYALPEEIVLHAPQVIGVGEEVDLEADFIPEGSWTEVIFSSGSPSYVQVSGNSAKGIRYSREVKISANTEDGLSDTVVVKVLYAPGRITLNVPQTTLPVGESTEISIAYQKSTYGGGYTLSADTEGIVEIDGNVVTAKAPGTVELTAEAYNGVKDKKTIIVPEMPDELYVESELKLGVGMVETLEVGMPEGTASGLKFESSNAEAVSVSEDGTLEAKAEGEAIITVTAKNSGVTASCAVKVYPAPEEIYPLETEIELMVGERRLIECGFKPENAFGAFKLKPENESIVKTEKDNALVGARAGSTEVTITAYNGVEAVLNVEVLKAPTAVQIDKKLLNLKSGESYQLAYTLVGDGFTKVSYESLDPNIATVDPETGVVQAVSTGTVFIVARTLNGLHTSCVVNVDIEKTAQETVDGDFEITFMDIGRNDGILISCGGEYAFIDSGMYSYGKRAVEYLQSRGITKLKYYIGTHAHKDHVAGAAAIVAALDVESIIVNRDYAYNCMIGFAETQEEKNILQNTPYMVLSRGEQIYLGGAKITCLGPVAIHGYSYRSIEENRNSLVMRVTYGDHSVLLTGDATKTELKEIEEADPGCLRADIHKNPHHNANLNATLLNYIQAKLTIISTSKDARPSGSYLNLLKQHGSAVAVTSPTYNSHITVTSDGTNFHTTVTKGEVITP